VLDHVALGQSNKDIARTLTVSEETVKGHLRNIFLKLDVTDRTQAVTVAIRRGIIALH
jgi:DNA-binding NarL/FixJ family response regulator